MAGIYLHVPFCVQKCSYCNFTSYPDKLPFQDEYVNAMLLEIEQNKDNDFKVNSIYFGGGTPSLLSAENFEKLINKIKCSFLVDENAEITVEINPGTICKEKLGVYKKNGVNRYSLGMQSGLDVRLKELNRIHTVKDFERACNLLKGENFSCDMLIGLKNMQFEEIEKGIELISKNGASHVSVYSLTAEEGTPIYKDYEKGLLPDEDEVRAEYDYCVKELERRGFKRYEISNFSKDGFYSRHNYNYWKRGEYFGFGISASGFINGVRYTNTSNFNEYISNLKNGLKIREIEEVVGENEAKFEYLMLMLRTDNGVLLKKYRQIFGSELLEDFKEEIKRNEKFLKIEKEKISIKKEFLYVSNAILCDFLNY